jgi:NADP-dependent 3-hydroxy acid dehydrogenase YdfG
MKRLTLAGSTTVITGAASGMGAAIARLLAPRGTHLALLDRDADALAALAAELTSAAGRVAGSGITVTAHVIDLRDDDAVFATAAEVTLAHPRINALITCAGSSMLGTLDQLTMEEMRWLTDVNVWGTV